MQYSDLLIKLLKKDTCIVIFNNIKIHEDGIKSTKGQSKFGTLKICISELRNEQATKASLLKREYQQSQETSDKTIARHILYQNTSVYPQFTAETYTYRMSLFKILS